MSIDKKIKVTFGKITISNSDDRPNHYWLLHDSGEGTEVEKEEFDEEIEELFREFM